MNIEDQLCDQCLAKLKRLGILHPGDLCDRCQIKVDEWAKVVVIDDYEE